MTVHTDVKILPGGDILVHALTSDGRRIGSLTVWRIHADVVWGIIHHVRVEPEFRHQGIATAMLADARTLIPDIRHSHTRTADGDAWARAVGGEIVAPVAA
jgi:GNAT superfamily N-acetyltransferase